MSVKLDLTVISNQPLTLANSKITSTRIFNKSPGLWLKTLYVCVFQTALLLHCAIPRTRTGSAVFLRTQAGAWATFQDTFSTRKVSSARSLFMEVVVETKTTSKQRRTACFRVSLVRKIGHYCLLFILKGLKEGISNSGLCYYLLFALSISCPSYSPSGSHLDHSSEFCLRPSPSYFSSGYASCQHISQPIFQCYL